MIRGIEDGSSVARSFGVINKEIQNPQDYVYHEMKGRFLDF